MFAHPWPFCTAAMERARLLRAPPLRSDVDYARGRTVRARPHSARAARQRQATWTDDLANRTPIKADCG